MDAGSQDAKTETEFDQLPNLRIFMEREAMRKLLFAFAIGAAVWIAPAVQAQAPEAVVVSQAPASPAATGTVPTPLPPPPGAALPMLPGPDCAPAPTSCAAPCEQPCNIKTKKVCVGEPTTRIIKTWVYCSQTKDFCLPKCALCGGHAKPGCSTCDTCGHGHGVKCPECPQCGHPFHKRVLMKKVCETECPDVKCHVEEQVVMPTCHTPTCHTPCASGNCPSGCCPAGTVVPGTVAPGTQVFPIAPPAGSQPFMPPVTSVVPQPMPAPTATDLSVPVSAIPTIHN